MTRNKSREAAQQSLDKKLDVPKVFYGWLGNDNDVVDVPGRVNYVYVRMTDGMVTQAYNVVVPSILNLPVICGYDQNQLSSGLLKVLSIRNVPRQTPNSTPPSSTLVSHHKSHEWMNAEGGQDVTFIELRQYTPLRPSIIEPFTIRIERGVLKLRDSLDNGVWTYLPPQTIDLSEYVPMAPEPGLSGSAVLGRYVLVSLEATSGSPVATSGSLVPITEISLADIPETAESMFPICAVFTYYYQEKFSEARTRTDLIDLRFAMFDRPDSYTVYNHNNLLGLQGGGGGDEYYHLSNFEHTIATQASGSGQDGYLMASDWNKFNTASGQVVPDSHIPVPDFYLTGYDKTSGSFSSGSVSPSSGASGSHNDLYGLQGGTNEEYYHLTNAEHTIATQASGSGQDGYLKSEDYNQFKLASGSGAQYLSDLLDVNIVAPTDKQALVYDAGTDKWIPGSAGTSGSGGIPEAPIDGKTYGRKDAGWTEIVSGSGGSSGSGASTFLELTDTPSSYSGQAGKVVTVNSGGTGLEFVSLEALLAIGFFSVDVYVSDGDSPV